MKPILRFFGTAALLAGRGAGAQEQLNRNPIAPTNSDKSLDSNQINLGDGSNVKEIRNYIFPATTNPEFGEIGLNGESNINKKKPSLSFSDADYFGDVVGDQMHGKGVLILADGATYDGEFQDGKKHGRGVLTWENGDKYDGEFQDDKRHGKGVVIWADGGVYDGEFQDGKKHGRGVLTWENGDKYDGEFQDDKKHGKGVRVSGSGEKYETEYYKGVESFGKQDKNHYIDTSSLLKMGMILPAVLAIMSLAEIFYNQRRAKDVPKNKEGFRPEEELYKAVYGFAKNISELEFYYDSPQQKEGLLLLSIERAGKIFESISQTSYSQILEFQTNQLGYVTTANLKLEAKLGEKTLSEMITTYPLEISAEKENINKTPKVFFAISQNQISEITDQFLTSVVKSFLGDIPECPQKEELNTILKNNLESIHNNEKIKNIRTSNGLIIEKNFTYNVALKNGVVHPILNREKLKEVLQIFRQGVRDYYKELHGEVYEEKAKKTAGELMEELVAKIERDSAKNSSASGSNPKTVVEVPEFKSLAPKTHSNEVE